MARHPEDDSNNDARAGKRVMYVLAGTGLLWILATEIGKTYDWPMRVSAAFDLLALAGFALGLWMTYQIWRRRSDGSQRDKDRDGDDRNDKR